MPTRNVLSTDEYGSFYAHYVSLVPPGITLRSALDDSESQLVDYLSEVTPEREDYAYGPGKWTVKQALQHLIDSERIFAYRALRLGRHDSAALVGFEQNDYVAAVDLSGRAFGRMVAEFRAVRQTTLTLFDGLSDDDLAFVGTVSGHPMSCRAMGFIICGHTYHHHNLYRERYGGVR